jgi:predicted ATPase/DNA-binding SARP family transcriptional activator
MSQLKLSLLGPPRVEWDGHEVVLSLRRGLALLAYLSLTDRLHRREELCALLWPDVDEREARSRLRHTLHRTSELVGHSLFDAEGDAVGLANDIDVWLDTWQLERALPDGRIRQEQIGELRDVAASYRGDLLSGFTIPDSSTWDDWQFLEREHFRQLAGQLFRALAEEELATGEWETGISHARQWLSLDHMHEPAHRLLMQLYAASGQHAAALRQYEQCVRTLQSELGVEPESETEALHQSIRARRFTVETRRSNTNVPPAVERVSPTAISAELAPSRPACGGTHNVPTGLARYIGRESERESIMALLGRTALLTLTGPGGVGKTRFAIELASKVAEEVRREVRFVELSSLSDPARVPATVAAALGVADAAAWPTVDTLIRALQGRDPLIVLDNCEHVLDTCSALVDAVLHACDGVTVLATSREPLGLSWEAVWPMVPLAIPAEGGGEVNAIADVESVQLFVDRARMLRPSFTLSDANAADVAEICRRLDGIPLAIELAAVRLRVLSPRQILERLDDRFRLLTGGSRSVPARQQTLEATIEWSHHLLTDAEQILFRQLAVFAGGWTLEAAEEVCALGTSAELSVLDLMASLVDKSLVMVDVRNEAPRYGFLETIRAFAVNRLRSSTDEALTRDRHQAWCFGLLREASYPLWGPDQVIWMTRLDQELDNIRAALDWCEHSPSSVSEALEQCSFSLYRYWDVRGMASEARSRLHSLLALAARNASPGGVAQSEAFLAHFYLMGGASQKAHDRALTAVALARDADDPWALIHTILVSTIIHGLLHNFDLVPGLCREGLDLARVIGHPFGTAPWNYWMGEVACMEGRLDEGERLLQECHDVVATIGDTRELSTVIFVQGHAALLRGDLSRAERLIQETLRERYASRDAQVVPHCLDALGWVASARGQPERAARLLGTGQAAAERAGVILLPIWQGDRDRAGSEARSRLGDLRFGELLDEGRALTLDQAVELALLSGETEPRA